jgi:predicted CXXCH cytochrome family protein
MRASRHLHVAVATIAALGCARPADRGPAAVEPAPEAELVRSNVLRADYAGSAECGDCHADLFERWRRSPMHRMTRIARRDAVEAPFDGAVLRVGPDSATMEERDGKRFVRVDSTRDGTRIYRVTKVIGGRYREDFAGVDVTDAHDPATHWGHEKVLPVSYVYQTASWRYKGYSVMVPERPGLQVNARWSKQCIGCHNTIPQLTLLYDDLRGPGAAPYQGRVSDDLVPADRTWRVEPIDVDGLKRAIADEIERIGGAPPDPAAPLADVLDAAIPEARRALGAGDLVEIGVGCESCHGGAAEHVDDPALRPTFELRSPLVRAVPPTSRATKPQWINRTCARCHTVLFTRYPWTWEGGRRSDRQPGGSTTNSGEGRDFLLGGCADAMACTTCHDPHAEDRRDRLDEIGGPAGNAICAACHPAHATPAGLRAHSHHPPGAGNACVGCHMPRKNMGLGYDLVRYHRIGSPTDAARVLGDRPLECALCHADHSVEQLVTTMEQWWGKRYDRDRLRAQYGDDLGVNVLDSTLARGKPHEVAAAIGVLGERGALAHVPKLAPHLAHEYPLVRFYAKHAIELITGEPLPIDVGRPAADVARDVERWLASR